MRSIRFMVVLVPVLLTGCVVAIGNDAPGREADWKALEAENRAAIETLRLGMGLREVQAAMPHPADFNEAFSVEGIAHRVLFYRTQRVAGDGVTSRDETTPLVFVEGELVGWGASAWREATGRPLAVID